MLKNLFKRFRKAEEQPVLDPIAPGLSVCPEKWLALVHHLVQDQAGCGWLTGLRPGEAVAIRRGLEKLQLDDVEAAWVAERMNRPYSELVFGREVTAADIRFALGQKYDTGEQ